MKYRWEIINWLIKRYGYKSYLEIGVKDGACFNYVKCDEKAGMDINPLISGPGISSVSSNLYFSLIDQAFPKGEIRHHSQFDIIFIDGDHREEQVDKDIENSLRWLRPNGTIVMHDCNPKKAIYATPERGENQPLWSGTAYRSFLKMRQNPKLSAFVVDIDWGCGVIRQGAQTPIELPDPFSYEDFDTHRTEWLDLLTVNQFIRRLK